MMRRSWGLTIITLLLALVFVSGCAKKTALKEEITPKAPAAAESATPVANATEKSFLKDKEDAKKRTEQERLAKERATKDEAIENAAKQKAAAVSSKELYALVDIHFDFDKFNLRDEAKATINKHAEWLNKNKDVKITIEGHCDERGTSEYNLALGERRANVVVKYLTDMGIDGKRIKAISYGLELPLDNRHNEEAWTTNRRANFVVSSK
jgi:peptidoglycan-associated lipoprotein